MTDGVQVRVADLAVTIGGVDVLTGVDVSFAPGTLTAVVGPSGSGKTTLFNVLARLRAPTSGTVDVDGTPLGSATVRIGLVHQAFALLSLLTAAENVELAAQIEGRRKRRVLRDAADCLAAVDLTARADHLVEELSGGEQQRVAIARAMITNPQLLLADEPTAQLDPANREHVVELLRSIATAGATVLVATHDLEVAGQCDSIVELRSGAVVSNTLAPHPESAMPVKLEQVAELAAALPETVESTSYGDRSWTVGGTTFAWERRFSKADVRRFGDDPVPAGVILAVRLADLGEKDAILGADIRGVFTIPHFDNYAAVLVQLKIATKTAVRALLVDGWLACAPPALADEHAASLTRPRR